LINGKKIPGIGKGIVLMIKQYLNKVKKPISLSFVDKNNIISIKSVSTVKSSKSKSKSKLPSRGKRVVYDVKKGILLADSYYKDGKAIIDPTGWWLSEKFDGVRGLWNGIELLSRTGKKINAPKSFINQLPIGVALDGELITGRGKFNEVSSITSKKIPIEEEWKKIKYQVFDLPSSNKPFEERIVELSTLLDARGSRVINKTGHIEIQSSNHLSQLHKNIVDNHGEGSMIRKPGSKYVNKRSSTLLKVKDFRDEDAIIIGHELGNGKYSADLGKLVVKWVKRPDVILRVGTGLTDKLRRGNYKKELKEGTVIIVKFFELTPTGKPRFPVFLGKRHEQDMINSKN
jgi:DNA ligase-1